MESLQLTLILLTLNAQDIYSNADTITPLNNLELLTEILYFITK
jgi:hypothetical protein